jgi:hypothetical protein
MIDWPNSLVTELAERRCTIVMGAGVSAGSISADGQSSPPDWSHLLHDIAELVQGEHAEYSRELIEKQQNLDAAQIIFDNSNSADRTRFFRDKLDAPRFRASEMHQIIHRLDPKIVITTNYDQIYENYCRQGQGAQGYNVCKYYEDHFLNDVRSDIRCILKAHGCISDPTKIVLTRSSYFAARRAYPSFYALLDALFLTSTLLFVGAGLTDPDIQLILENANLAASSGNHHYALVPRGRHPSIVAAIRNTYNIALLEYAENEHQEAIDALRSLGDAVESYRAVTN